MKWLNELKDIYSYGVCDRILVFRAALCGCPYMKFEVLENKFS
jgi:hypothetical protein